MSVNTFKYWSTAGFPGFLTTLPSGINNIMHESWPSTMQRGRSPWIWIRQLGCFLISWSSKWSPIVWIGHLKKIAECGPKVDKLALMYIGSPLLSMFSGTEMGTVGVLGQWTHWTRTPFRFKTRNCRLPIVVWVGKSGESPCRAPCNAKTNEGELWHYVLCLVEMSEGDDYVMLSPFQELFRQNMRTWNIANEEKPKCTSQTIQRGK